MEFGYVPGRLSISPIGERSRAALLEGIRASASQLVIWANLKRRTRSGENSGRREVIHMDVVSAIKTGLIVDAFRPAASHPYWIVTIAGMDSTGERLGLIVNFSDDGAEPLQVTDVFFPK